MQQTTPSADVAKLLPRKKLFLSYRPTMQITGANETIADLATLLNRRVVHL